ncbi:hypothetical protein FNV43_RR11695 [Rhamnella rubrinervis]|uniref:Mitochondrial adenine nucleotide transporter BTL3 n=1 Tax=Rhamnella rubrinervis TaxID=2594499 RepID=A0A8K0H698_9ROSA|nr:hypothetical protein FNV43_RR11695 [Rhamnella rubrinervis]
MHNAAMGAKLQNPPFSSNREARDCNPIYILFPHGLSQTPFSFSSNSSFFVRGGLFLEPTISESFLLSVSPRKQVAIGVSGSVSSSVCRCKVNEYEGSEEAIVEETKEEKVRLRGVGAMNTTKHLWAGAIAAMVSRLSFVFSSVSTVFVKESISARQDNCGYSRFERLLEGNLVNILRTAPFKAVNFYAYDTYRKQLLKFSGNEDTTNFERFISGAAAGITATVLCLPLDTIRTKMVAPGGEALGGVIDAFRHMIQTEGFFALYKGLVPSIISMAPSGAVFYGVYDILKSAYLHSPEGRKRIQNMNQHGKELTALDQLELGPVRTLAYGAIAGASAEAATYPFEVVRRQLQLQVQATKLSALATCVKVVQQGGISALYAGLIPSLLQVLPSASISYFVYEFMKIVLKVE